MIIEKPYKVAIIDDSTVMQKFLSEACRQVPNFEPHCFTDAHDALKFIEREKVRIVFIDINMPSMFGDDVLRKCIQLKLGIQAYVITGADSLTIADRCMNVGARGIIPKPMLNEGFANALRESERFFKQWNETMRYFLKHKNPAA